MTKLENIFPMPEEVIYELSLPDGEGPDYEDGPEFDGWEERSGITDEGS